MLFFDHRVTIDDNLVAFNRDHLTSIFVDKIFMPCVQNTGCKFSSNDFFQAGFRDFNLFSKIKDLKDIFVTLVPNGTEKCGYG